MMHDYLPVFIDDPTESNRRTDGSLGKEISIHGTSAIKHVQAFSISPSCVEKVYPMGGP